MHQPTERPGGVILAAGKGTRMHSDCPKVLQRILQEPLLRYVYKACHPLLGDDVITVVGHAADAVKAAFPEHAHRFVEQPEQLGTGHALSCAWPAVQSAGYSHVLVINGDTPLVPAEVLRAFYESCLAQKADIAFISLSLADTGSLGLVLRDKGAVRAIVEAKDYDQALHGPKPSEVNAGIYCLARDAVTPLLPLLRNSNKSGEYYITDLVALGLEKGLHVLALDHGDDPYLLGVNSPEELVRSEEAARRAIVAGHQQAGVIIRAADSVRIGPDVSIAPGADICGPCEIYGASSIGQGARIASHCRLDSAAVAKDVDMRSFCHVEKAVIGPGAIVGPYARLRPGAVLEEGSHVGNFVEMKQARLGKGAKANHLTYLGDASVGAGANIGAGTITCNYDGKNKHKTTIGDRAFIGSNSALVAPVTIGADALVGAGSVITSDVADGQLALTRAPQQTRPRRKG